MLPDGFFRDLLSAFGVRVEGVLNDDLRHLLAAARRVSLEAAATVLTVLVGQDVRLSQAGQAELDRACGRAAIYGSLFASVSDFGIRAKGGSIDAFYPHGVRRFGNDLDIVFATPALLWAAADRLERDFGPTEVTMALLGDHLAISMRRDAPHPAEERSLKLELSTVALLGDGAASPMVAAVPVPVPAAQLLFVAEEHFQRSWHPLDAVDAAVLTSADAWHGVGPLLNLRASALLSLADHMEAHTSARVPHRVRERLTGAASIGIEQVALPPQVLQGLRVSQRSQPPERTEVAGRQIMRSPIGTFLLSSDAVYRSEDLALIAELDRSA